MIVKIKYFGNLDNMKPDLGLFELDPLLQPPVSVIGYISEKQNLDSFKCPAVKKYLKNIFYITSPFDFTIRRISDSRFEMVNDRTAKNNLQDFLYIGYPETKLLNRSPALTIHLQYYFLNNGNNITMSVIDPPFDPMPLTNICGEFNISKWIRPTNFSFFLNSDCQEITFKRGDPLYAIKFNTDKRILFEEIASEEERKKILTEQQKAVSIKKWYPNIALDQSYKLFKNRMKSIFK